MVATPKRDRRAERREATRREILDVAWELAREHGLAGITLRHIAARVGMQPPSLYSHFPSKNAIYDAMFGESWQALLDIAAPLELPADPRAALKIVARTYFDFSVSDPARHQLMDQRTLPGFEPSPEAYAPAVAALDRLRVLLASAGVTDGAAVDLFTAVTGGLVAQQLANDPGGDRWRRLLDRAIDMYADEIGLAGPREEGTR